MKAYRNISVSAQEGSGLPLLASRVEAGFPSPAEDYIDGALDLNEYLIRHPAATYFVRVGGDSMIGANIHAGDLLIIDRALEPKNGDVVIASISGELTLKRLCNRDGKLLLVAANDAYSPIEVDAEADFQIWGVCKHVIHSL